METLLTDPFIETCNQLPIYDLVKVSEVSQRLKSRIRQHKWGHIVIILRDVKYIKDICTLSPKGQVGKYRVLGQRMRSILCPQLRKKYSYAILFLSSTTLYFPNKL